MNSYGIMAASAAILSFAITLALGKFFIPFLHKLKYGQTILEIGPSWHKNKQGTPTMGGIMFIIGILVSTAICIPFYYKLSEFMGIHRIETPLMAAKIFCGLAMAVGYGLIGFIDDYVKVRKKQNQGLTPKQKLILQFAVVILYFAAIHIMNNTFGGENLTKVGIPFFGKVDLGFFYYIILSLVVVGIVNAANLTDGVDGLCTSVTFLIAIFYMIMTNLLGMFGLSIESAALAGGCLGFLIWNLHPARVFMGDTGSLFLGGIVCALGLGSGLYVPMIILSSIYIAEMFSVILQVLYFKISGGKRLFKMSPIHHHFEMLGWSENKICTVFGLCTAVMGIISILLVVNNI